MFEVDHAGTELTLHRFVGWLDDDDPDPVEVMGSDEGISSVTVDETHTPH